MSIREIFKGRRPSWLSIFTAFVVVAALICGFVMPQEFRWRTVATQTVAVTAGDTSKSVTIPGLKVGNAVGAFHRGSASVPRNTTVVATYCTTPGVLIFQLSSAAQFTSNYTVLYVPSG